MNLKTTKVLAEVDKGIGWITFNNPERKNAMSLEMWEALSVAVDSFNTDDNVRVVVMKGAGEIAFISGGDISEFAAKCDNAGQKKDYGELVADADRRMAELNKPLIAMIRGYCLGGGVMAALGADVRICSDDSSFGIPVAKLGHAYEYRAVRALVDLIGPANTKDILFTGRRLNAKEALRIGLVNQVVTPEALRQTVVNYVETIGANAPLTLRAARLAVNEALKNEADRNLKKIEKLINVCFDSEDYREGRQAFLEKRKPVFRGR